MLLSYDTPQVEDMPLLQEWKLLHQIAFMFEISLEKALRLLPEGIYPVEVRPGVALVLIGYEHYDQGNLLYGKSAPEFYELTQFIVVQPDLSIDMPMPRYAFFVLQIGSNHADFIRQEIEIVKAKAFYTPSLQVQMNADKTDLQIADAQGDIQRLTNLQPQPEYREDAFWGQYFSVMDGALYLGIWNWRGQLFQHQRKGNTGHIGKHPFFMLEPDDLQTIYLHLLTNPDTPIRQRFYQPRRLWNL